LSHFPDLASPAVETIRTRYDPLANLLGAHVAFVFPFQDAIEEPELRRHLERSIVDTASLDLTLASVSAESDGYVFLNVSEGAARCIALHDRFTLALPVHGTVKPVSVVCIDGTDRGQVAFTIPLSAP
jgi:2'-5' RNA ligase superfamily protein